MYTTNQLLSHPLVSPVLQPSLGGLPPLLIMTGGGEALRDEQIYLAHKAANPAKYLSGKACLDEYSNDQDIKAKWKPTDVQLQVWDDLCHVAPTLSFTRPAKYMYRSIAQFGAWALSHAQNTEIEILDDDAISIRSSGSDTETDSVSQLKLKQSREAAIVSSDVTNDLTMSTAKVGKAGDPLPPFCNHMIRQRVDRHGHIHTLEPASLLPALQMAPNEIGVIKPGPVRKWLEGKQRWDTKFAREKRRVQKQRIKEMAQQSQGFGDDEVPPPSALAGRRHLKMPSGEKKKMSWGMSLWSLWGSSQDEKAIEREEKADKELEDSGATKHHSVNTRHANLAGRGHSRSRSRRCTVTDTGQTKSNTDNDIDENTTMAELLQQNEGVNGTQESHYTSPSLVSHQKGNDTECDANTMGITGNQKYSMHSTTGGLVVPFKLGRIMGDEGTNASTVTLTGMPGIVSPKAEEKERTLVQNVENKRDGYVVNGDKLDCPDIGNKGGANTAVDAGGVDSARRPEPERFVTATEGLPSRQN
ncbi:MAG: hypothetical protein M1830_006047 [Pleopsidium flavum]|nr:MAG: hypothetical protein M1830_006047 [Pleopsidium flavum]